MKPSDQPTMRRSCEAGDYVELAEAMPKVRGVAPYRAIKLLTHRPAETLREYDEALYVENGSIVRRSGTVKTESGGVLLGVKLIGGRDTDLYAIDSVTGELHGSMPKPPCKKTMQHSSELAESHRPLTVTDEVKTAMTGTYAFEDAIITERKRNLPLPKPISLDDYVSLMTQGHLLAPNGTSECGGRWQQLRPAGPNGPHRNLYTWKDNTVGPVTLTSGYGSNTFPYSAAHVLDPSMMSNTTHMVTDTRKCEPNASDTFGVPSNPTHFTGSASYVLTEINKDVSEIPSFTSSTLAVTQMANNNGPKSTCFTQLYGAFPLRCRRHHFTFWSGVDKVLMTSCHS